MAYVVIDVNMYGKSHIGQNNYLKNYYKKFIKISFKYPYSCCNGPTNIWRQVLLTEKRKMKTTVCEPQFKITTLKMSDIISLQWRITPGANLEIKTI